MIYIYDFHIKYKFKKCQKNKLAVSIQFIFYVLCRFKVHELVTESVQDTVMLISTIFCMKIVDLLTTSTFLCWTSYECRE